MATTLPPPVSFEKAGSWEQTAVELAEKLRTNNVVVWSTNIGLGGDDRRWPRQVVPHLPGHGIVVFVSTALEVDDPDSYPSRALPLRLRDGYFVSDTYHGQPAPHVSTTLIYARVNGRFVFVQIFYGTNTPTEEMFAEADVQLERLAL